MEINDIQNLDKIKSNEIPEIDFYDVNKDFTGEKWKALLFADQLYEISNYGRLKSYATNKKGIILRNRNTNNYLTVILSVSKNKRTFYIHKLVAEYFVLKVESKNIVIHLDNDRKNNYFENLKWVNAKECFENTEKFNNKFREKFRINKTSSAKISMQDAIQIRSMIAEGVVQSVIAKKYNISAMQITRIKRNENWKPKTKRPRIIKDSRKKIYIKK